MWKKILIIVSCYIKVLKFLKFRMRIMNKLDACDQLMIERFTDICFLMKYRMKHLLECSILLCVIALLLTQLVGNDSQFRAW